MPARDELGRLIPLMRLGGTVEKVSFSTSAALSAVISAENYGGGPLRDVTIEILCDQDCHIAAGESPTATTASHLIKADIPYRFAIRSGHRISVLRASADGTLYIVQNG